MATTLDLVGEKTPEIDGKMKKDKVEEIEEMMDTEVVEKIGEVIVEIAEERTMETLELTNLIMEEATTTAGKGKAHEEFAGRLQANESLL